MSKIFFTITGTCYRYGQDFIEQGMVVRLVKEPDNEFDKEAIKVEMEGSARSAMLLTVRALCWARAIAPAVCMTRLEMLSRARLCMFCLRECWGMLRWRRSAARLN